MKRYFFILVAVLVLAISLPILYGCGGDDSKTNRSGKATVTFSGNSKAVLNSIEVTVSLQDPDNKTGDCTLRKIEITDPWQNILIFTQDGGVEQREKSYDMQKFNLIVDWGYPSFTFIPQASGKYKIEGDVDDGEKGITEFSEELVIDELRIYTDLINNGDGEISYLKVSSNGDNMTYLVLFDKDGGALAMLRPESADTLYDIGVLEQDMIVRVEVTGYNHNPHFASAVVASAPIMKSFPPINYNRPPEINDSSANISTTVNIPVDLFIDAYDPDGDPLSHWWESTGDCAVFSNPNSAGTTVTYSQAGIYTVTVSVTDLAGGLAQRSSTITVANVVAPQEDDPNSLYEDANIIASTHIILYKKTGEIEVDIRPLLTPEGQAAFDADGEVFLWGALNDWNPTEEFKAEVSNNKVIINVADLNLDGDENYGISFVVILQNNFFWQDGLMAPDDLLLMGKDAGGGSVLAFHLNTDGTIDNLPPGTVVEN